MTVPLIGLTGGMGAGKTTALACLRRLGAETISTDEVVHSLYDTNEVLEAVRSRWGEQVISDGAVDRGKVAEIVFRDEAQRQWLEGLLWPLVGQRISRWVKDAKEGDSPPAAAVIEVPLLFESGLDAACDATIAVIASEDAIERRTADRGLIRVKERTTRQLSQQEKASRATFTIVNDGDMKDLERKLSEVLGKLSR